ncbi:MBL fold metallo-hydrolase [Leptospira sp. GIMC2001]|uniref:MBL fold metallo-hydrolase n=1 Tax=Leptospira sp. GIMC2001 TaxID=1513297 RepID=UPI00234AAE94|nr:MBL fold metallo-hydrolase [Leptospira sp. GIMC2001]WCL49039.1 MBL fold metallo-hydrolase [Leptospira sp. GIMC2001]
MLENFKKLSLLGLIGFTILTTANCSKKGTMFTFKTDANGFDTKNYYYDNGSAAVAFDTQFTPSYAKQSIEAFQSQSKTPILYVVITHPNPDKFNGISEYRKLGAKIIASEKTAQSMKEVHEYKKYFWVKIAKAFTEENYPKLEPIDITFNDKYEIDLGSGDKVNLIELGSAGVSSNQTVAYIPTTDSYVVGDLIHPNAHAWLEGGIVGGNAKPDINSWIQSLTKLQEIADSKSKVLAGRGKESTIGSAIPEQIAYLKAADSITKDYIETLGSKKSELKSDKAQSHYDKLQELISEKFPTYELKYMIGYGIYGLVNSKI